VSMPATTRAHACHFRTADAKSARDPRSCVWMSILFSQVQFAWVFKVEGLHLPSIFFLDTLVCPKSFITDSVVCNLHYEGFLIVELCDSLPPNETRAIYGIFVIFKILPYSCKSRCDVDMDKHGNEGQSSGTCSRKLKPSITINKNVIVRRPKKALNFCATTHNTQLTNVCGALLSCSCMRLCTHPSIPPREVQLNFLYSKPLCILYYRDYCA